MKVGRLLALAAVPLAISACFHQVIQTGNAAGSTVIDKPFAMSFVYGLVPVPDIDVSSECPRGIASVITEMSLKNLLVSVVSLGIVTPRHVTVTCAASAGTRGSAEFSVSRDATEDERAALLSRAIGESARTHQAVLVRF